MANRSNGNPLKARYPREHFVQPKRSGYILYRIPRTSFSLSKQTRLSNSTAIVLSGWSFQQTRRVFSIDNTSTENPAWMSRFLCAGRTEKAGSAEPKHQSGVSNVVPATGNPAGKQVNPARSAD
jgi:hypothetical protein